MSSIMSPKKPVLLLPREYIHDAANAIKRAKHRVSFLCMLVTDDEATDELIDALCETAERGVQVDVAADVFTYGELSGHFIPTRYFTKKTRATTNMMRQFENSKVNFNWLGRFSNTPFTGRTHIKWCVVDDTVYSFGGVNLYDTGISSNDYMFKVYDHDLATILISEYDRLVKADSGHFAYRSRSITTKTGITHIDGGLPFDSIIYRRACALAEEADKVTLVSQYCPTGKLSRLLRRTDAHLYFNPWRNAEGLDRLVIRSGMAFSRQKTRYTHKQYLHAKFILFEMPDGRRVALTGSHNFVQGGVLLGTREVALETEDARIYSALERFLKNHVL